jgi:3-oxo-4,17-pregnadiene-20-carboxyl-CoA hydratase alpha subunit
MSDAPARPVPAITPEMAPFWDAARRHELVAQRCLDCGAYRFPAREVCSRCLSHKVEWVRVAGTGRVFSIAIMHQADHPWFAAHVPYAVVVVELDEGTRMLSTVVGLEPHAIRIGMPVRVGFEDVTPEVSLPVFRPAA